jgi:hypothetical protein
MGRQLVSRSDAGQVAQKNRIVSPQRVQLPGAPPQSASLQQYFAQRPVVSALPTHDRPGWHQRLVVLSQGAHGGAVKLPAGQHTS